MRGSMHNGDDMTACPRCGLLFRGANGVEVHLHRTHGVESHRVDEHRRDYRAQHHGRGVAHYHGDPIKANHPRKSR